MPKVVDGLRFIPFSRQYIVEQLICSSDFDATQQAQFQQLSTLLNSLLHFDFHR